MLYCFCNSPNYKSLDDDDDDDNDDDGNGNGDDN